MTNALTLGSSLVTGLLLAAMIATAGASSARADDPNSGGDITVSGGDVTVTVVDPTASPSPSSSAAAGSGTTSPGRGSGSSGGSTSSSAPASPGGSGTGSSASGIPKWIVVSGFNSATHAELDPLRGWVRSTVTVANRSTSEKVSGELVFRLRSFLGGQVGPSVVREISGLRPGETSMPSVDLAGIGQWPLAQVAVTFRQSAAGHQGSMVREAWVLGFPWLLLVMAIAVLALLAIARIRRGAIVHAFRPEPAL